MGTLVGLSPPTALSQANPLSGFQLPVGHPGGNRVVPSAPSGHRQTWVGLLIPPNFLAVASGALYSNSLVNVTVCKKGIEMGQEGPGESCFGSPAQGLPQLLPHICQQGRGTAVLEEGMAGAGQAAGGWPSTCIAAQEGPFRGGRDPLPHTDGLRVAGVSTLRVLIEAPVPVTRSTSCGPSPGRGGLAGASSL